MSNPFDPLGIEEMARAAQEVNRFVCDLDRSLGEAARQLQRQTEMYRSAELEAHRAMQRHMADVAAVTRNLGYRW